MARLSAQTGLGGARGLPSSNQGRDAFLDAAGNLVNSEEELVSGASAIAPSHAPYSSQIITGGTAGSEDVNLGDGTASADNPAAVVGQRKLVTLKTRTNGSDVLNFDHANMSNSSGTVLTNFDLDAAGEFVLVEWDGTRWRVVHHTGTLAV